MILIFIPPDRILDDVLADGVQGMPVADDVFVIIALPYGQAGCTA